MHDRCFVNKVIGDHRHPASSENHISWAKTVFINSLHLKFFFALLDKDGTSLVIERGVRKSG